MADKILIVDDDPAICKLLEKVMHSNELETTTVNCGMDALSILKNHTFDLILMDIMLGDMEGFEVIKRLRNQGISTPVMIVSGRNEDYDSLYGLSLGAAATRIWYSTIPILWNAVHSAMIPQPCVFTKMAKNLSFLPRSLHFFCFL